MRVNAMLWSWLTGVAALVVTPMLTWSTPGPVRFDWRTTRGRDADAHGGCGAGTMRRIWPEDATTYRSPLSSSANEVIWWLVSSASTVVQLAGPGGGALLKMPFQIRPLQKSP